jgi:hypothetical protein
MVAEAEAEAEAEAADAEVEGMAMTTANDREGCSSNGNDSGGSDLLEQMASGEVSVVL